MAKKDTGEKKAEKPPFKPTLLYTPVRDGDKEFKVAVTREEGDKYGTNLGTVTCYTFREPNYWKITDTSPREYADHVGHLQFPNKELAGNFLKALINRCQEIVAERPLPEDINNHFNRRADELRKEEQALHSRFMDLRFERYALLNFAKKYGIREAAYMSESADLQSLVNDVYEFKITHNGEEVHFFSEKCLYELVGKDDARSILGRISRLAKAVCPTAETY